MNQVSRGTAAERSQPTTTPRGSGRLGSLLLGVALVFVYMMNGRDMGTYDTIATTVLPLRILRGHGIYLDDGPTGMRRAKPAHNEFVTISHGRLVSLYPIAPAVVAVPLFAPQVAILDLYRPGWDRDRLMETVECLKMARRSMAVVVALVGVVLHRLLLAMGTSRAALPAVLAACMGSDLWMVGSQALWQHGPAALALVTAITLLHRRPAGRLRLAASGACAAILVACRLMDIVFAVAIVMWLAWTNWRGLRWFAPAPILVATALLSYNLWFFDSILGGQAAIEKLHTKVHGTSGPWSGNLVDGLLGTLFSPNRGLLVFSPWVAVAILSLGVPAVRRRLAAHSLFPVMLASLFPYLLILSKYSVWWGGHCFGPRYWTDAMPLFAIPFAHGLQWMLTRSRVLVAISALTVGFSIAVQVIGAFCYPSSWNLEPRNVDTHHERLWDWRDTELSRCLIETFETPRPAAPRREAIPRSSESPAGRR